MIKGFAGLERIKTKEEFLELVAKAKEDSHGVFEPTLAVKKDGKLVGYFSIGQPGFVTVFAWLSTKEMAARESFHLINTVEGMASANGAKAICFPVPKDSPFHPLMKEMGFVSAGTYEYFVKEL